MPGSIHIGTSGFHYSDWRGVFYPARLPAAEMLPYYMRYFDVLEVNYTHYRMPETQRIADLVRRTDGKLGFFIKAYRGFTHQDSDVSLKTFVNALEPMRAAQTLKGILFQYPFRFKNTPGNRKKVRWQLRQLGNIQSVVEFRHESWISEAVFRFLSDMGVAFCCVDQPRLPGLPGPVSTVTAPVGYIRFHGRNAEKWWSTGKAWERYDFQYTPKDLYPWCRVIRKMVEHTRAVYVFFNNHYRGQAVRNAQLLMAFLDDLR